MDHIGAYLYFDRNVWEFVRSGKVCAPVVPKGVGDRNDEHEKAASKKAFTNNKFYTCFPTKANSRSKSKLARGVFESLT